MKVITLTVLQFNSFVKQIFDSEDFLSNIAIVGEVTNFKISGSNAFFDLKDDQAMISCVMFGSNGLKIKNGDLVTAQGKVNFYVKSGKINFIVREVSAYGLGDLYKQFILLKEKLESEGYFKEEIKKEIPKFAQKIGVITSETGAVIRDIINVTRSKNPYTDIVVYPSKVQGIGAEDEICDGIRYFDSRDDIDTVIIARGGGSLEDLSPFNTEKVVKAIYLASKPIISAVGHETDFTLCDFASDLRVPTPSVAGEVAVFDYYEQVKLIEQIINSNNCNMLNLISHKKQDLLTITASAIDKLKLKIESNKNSLILILNEIKNLINTNIEKKKTCLNNIINVISKQNPLEILKSGYCVIEKDSAKIFSVENISIDDKIDITMTDGNIVASVEKIEKKEQL